MGSGSLNATSLIDLHIGHSEGTSDEAWKALNGIHKNANLTEKSSFYVIALFAAVAQNKFLIDMRGIEIFILYQKFYSFIASDLRII